MENQNEHYRTLAHELMNRDFEVELDTESKTGRIRALNVVYPRIGLFDKMIELQKEFPDCLVWGNTNFGKIYLRLRKNLPTPA